jgi:membrane-bound lytic murein transglycosylase B
MRFLAITAFTSIWLLGCYGYVCGKTLDSPDAFAALKIRLVRDGFDESLIQSLYARSEVTFDHQTVSVYFLHREVSLNYDQFLTESSINHASDYLEKYQKTLRQAQSVYGVDGEIITAIMLVETRLGDVTGKRLVLNTLSTLAALDDKKSRDNLWRSYLKDKADITKRQFDKWATRKSAWAYDELKAYLKYVEAQGLDPLSMPGSFAGALGIAQFIPSNVLKFAQDGNGDGQINLFDHEDAIESIANYLNQHGWRPSLKRDEALEVLLRYNHSEYYAETILKVAERLAQRQQK